MAVYPGASFACGVDDDASSLPNLLSRNKEVRGAGWGGRAQHPFRAGQSPVRTSSAVLFVSVSWVAVKQGWIGSEEEGYGVLGA